MQQDLVSGGALLFHEWITTRKRIKGITNQSIASEFGWDASFITHLIKGTKRPSLLSAIKIQIRAGVPCQFWALQGEVKGIRFARPKKQRKEQRKKRKGV
jgi:plasmid maintenance system antidote protein VapI